MQLPTSRRFPSRSAVPRWRPITRPSSPANNCCSSAWKGPPRPLPDLAVVGESRVAALVVVGHRTPPRHVPDNVFVEELRQGVDVSRVEGVVGALHDRHVLICHSFLLCPLSMLLPPSQRP